MEALFLSLVAKYGFDIAAKMLGLDKQQENPKYAISLGGMELNPLNMLKRIGVNQGIKSITKGGLLPANMGVMGPLMLGGALGLGYLTNPLRQGSMNYNPYLKDQIDYLSENNMIGIDQSGLTKYGPDSILSGQNVVSMFGTNNYLDQLNKYKAKYKDTMPKHRLEKLNKEIADYELDQVNKELKADAAKTLKNINANNNNGGSGYSVPDRSDKSGGDHSTSTSGSSGGFTNPGSGSYGPHSGGGYQQSKGSHHYERGGIASL